MQKLEEISHVWKLHVRNDDIHSYQIRIGRLELWEKLNHAMNLLGFCSCALQNPCFDEVD